MKSPFKPPPAERTVRLRSSGFESSVVRSPTWSEDDSLAWFFQHPARVNPSAFATALLAACLVPARRPSEVAAVPESDRARLRRAVIAVCGRKREWRGLHGSHLSGDERLMAVMVWRWSEHELALTRLRESQRELFDSAHALGGKPVVPADTGLGLAFVVQQAMRSMAVYDRVLNPLPNYSKLFQPLFPDYAKSLRLFTGNSAVFDPLPNYSKLLRPFAHGSLALTGFSDPAATEAARLARGLYADPSPLVLRAGGPSSFIWSQQVRDMLGLGKPAWMETVQKMTDRLLGPRGHLGGDLLGLQHTVEASLSLERMFGVDPTKAAVLRMPVMPTLPSLPFDTSEMFTRLTGAPLEEFFEAVEEAELVAQRWEQRALWYLLAQLGLHDLRRLSSLTRAEVEDAVLYALEAVITDGEVVVALRAAVERAPHLAKLHRVHLDHCLEHAGEGSYIQASGSLYPGLEGAFGQIGYVRALITADRRRTDNPKKKVQFETMVKRLGLNQEFELFVVTAVFGDAGDPYRHGHGDSEEGVRKQVLFGIAALAGWLQEFGDYEALDVLAWRMRQALPAAIERAGRPLLPPGDG
jgi:hypothetical protein